MNSALRQTIVRIVATYVVLAGIWIALSDHLLLWWFRDPSSLAIASTLKGWVFVAVTAVMLSLLLSRTLSRIERSRARLHDSEEHFHNVFDAVSDGILLQHPLSGAILDVNQRAIELYGYAREEMLRMDVGQLSAGYPPYGLSEATVWLLKTCSQGPQSFDWLARSRSGLLFWVEVTTRLVTMAGQQVILVTVHDIRERKQLERSLRRRQSMFAVLSGTNQAIVHAKNRQQLFEQVCQVALKIGKFRLAWIGSAQEGVSRHVIPLVSAGEADAFLTQLATHTWQDLIEAETPTGLAWSQQRHVVVNDFDAARNPLVQQDRSAPVYGLCSGMAMPINGGGFSGTLTVYASEPGFFDQEVVDLMLEVASDISFALKNLRETERQAAALEQLKLHARVFDESRDGILITDANNRILMINQAFSDLFGYSLDEVLGLNPRLLRSGRNSPEFYRAMWESLRTDGRWKGEIWNRRKDGELLPCWAKINVVEDAAGQVVNYFEVFSDLSEYKAKEELQWLKRFDALTRLPNRLVLEDRTRESIAVAQQTGHGVALLSVNLDRFHYVNESLGHAAGDKLLQIMAERFRESVGESAIVSRLSGGAFVVLLPEIAESAQAATVASNLLRSTAQVVELGDTQISQGACIGIALYPNDGVDFEVLLKHADAARIEAVEIGGNHYRFYIEDLNDRVRSRLSLSAELVQALEHQRFVLHYQPQLEAISGRVTGVEALLRFQHPQRGLVSPAEFIPVAEETGLIVPLGAWVIGEACRQLQRWQAFGALTMAINLSPMQLQDSQLLATIQQALADTGVNPQQIEFEFTEGALMRNSVTNLGLMQRLKGLGLRLSIDDFGTGYSSLSYLKQFPIDRIKIDQSFVCGIPRDSNDVAIVEAIIALSRALGLATIGEGVETADQADYLRLLQCDELQGYLFSRPASAEDIGRWLQGQSVAG